MKKLTSILLSVIISISAVSFVYAEEDYSEVLEGVKAIFDIPDYDKFDCYIGDEYYFTWTNDDGSSLDIAADKDINIYDYYKSIKESDKDKAAVVDEAQAKAIADEFLKKAVGDNYVLYQYNADKTQKYTNYIDFQYDAYINGMRILNGGAYISVDTVNAEAINYNTGLPRCTLNTSKPNIAALNKVKEGFFENGNVSLVYKNVYNDEDDTVTAKPLYIADNYVIDAATGKLYENDNEEYGYRAEDAEATADAGGGVNSSKSALTKVEKAEIEKLNNAVTADEALKLVKDKFNITLNSDNINTGYYKKNEDYIISINSYENDSYFRASVNSDRNITSLYYQNENILSGSDNIKAFAKKLYPETDIPAKLNEKTKEYNSCTFYGKYDGVKDLGSYIEFDYDKDLNVNSISYSYNDNEHIKYIGSLTNDDIWNIILNNNSMEPVYLSDGALVYNFEKLFTIDANTGEYLDYNGREPQAEDFNKYTDVEGVWYEDIANTLISYGYRFAEDKFMGDKAVTGADIIQFFKNEGIEIYRANNYDDIFKEYADNPDKEITKYEMADIIVKYIGYEEIAQKAEFVKPFEDVDNENTGNVAVCKALGIAKGDNNRFNGDKIITRAEMAAMVYYSL